MVILKKRRRIKLNAKPFYYLEVAHLATQFAKAMNLEVEETDFDEFYNEYMLTQKDMEKRKINDELTINTYKDDTIGEILANKVYRLFLKSIRPIANLVAKFNSDNKTDYFVWIKIDKNGNTKIVSREWKRKNVDIVPQLPIERTPSGDVYLDIED